MGTEVMEEGLPEPRESWSLTWTGPPPNFTPSAGSFRSLSRQEPARAEFHKLGTDLEPMGKHRAVLTKRSPRLSHILS